MMEWFKLHYMQSYGFGWIGIKKISCAFININLLISGIIKIQDLPGDCLQHPG